MHRLSFRSLTGLLLMSAMLLGAGCAHRQSRLPFYYDQGGVPRSYKRIEQMPQRDFVHHWVRKAYEKPNPMFEPIGQAQCSTAKAWGWPDFIRKPFRSLENEKVDEWLYIDKHRVFQFVGKDLVYEGPLTDYEQTMVQRGYPDRCNVVRRENGQREDLFIYTKVFTPWLEQFKFRDGMIIQSQEGF